MRTTVTLDPDVEQIVRQRMREQNVPFKTAVNDAIRSGAPGRGQTEPFRTATASLGDSRVNLDRALALAGDLEDEDLVRKLRAGS